MSFEFSETMTIVLPDAEERFRALSESAVKQEKGIIIEVSAIHEGMTANYNFYSADVLKNSIESWVRPYPKPLIRNHDLHSEPLGRVMAAKMDKEADGSPYVKLQVAVTDPEAVAKVMDQRYLTGSVGGKAEEAVCSVCKADWASASLLRRPCEHERGKTYKGKLMYLEMNNVSFKEYSIVSAPADQRSGIRSFGTTTDMEDNKESEESQDDWVRAATPMRVFALDMNDQEVIEFSESENTNILEGLKKKESTPIYMNLKGAFLSALATSAHNKEANVAEEDEDILAVTDTLSADLAEPKEDKKADEEADEVEDTVEEGEETEETEESNKETDAAEGERPEGQEDVSGDVDPENSEGAPKSREGEDGEEETAEVTDTDSEEETADETEDETDLNETLRALESRVEELEGRESTLLEENARLKSALKRSLAERVVDSKISLGLVEADERAEAVEDHATRSASSLADSLRDLAKMSPVDRVTPTPPEIRQESQAVTDDNAVIEGEEDPEEKAEEEIDPEEILVDVLMGRRSF